jgi:hypothetical protein
LVPADSSALRPWRTILSRPVFDESHGPRIATTFARVNGSALRRSTTDTLQQSLHDNVALGSVDARWRRTFIDQRQDEHGNDFGVNLEFSYAMCWLAGDGADGQAFPTLR